jgi:hypothetical protein
MPQSTRCKFKCQSVTEFEGGFSAEFYAVHSGSPENEKFFKFTPNASLKLQTLHEKGFEVGAQYYLDITKAE